MITHSREKRFACKICQKRFTLSFGLTQHQRTYTGEKPYKCEMCKKCFFSSSNLSFDQRIHTGEKPFQCPICTKHFTSSSILIQHQITYHEKKVSNVIHVRNVSLMVLFYLVIEKLILAENLLIVNYVKNNLPQNLI